MKRTVSAGLYRLLDQDAEMGPRLFCAQTEQDCTLRSRLMTVHLRHCQYPASASNSLSGSCRLGVAALLLALSRAAAVQQHTSVCQPCSFFPRASKVSATTPLELAAFCKSLPACIRPHHGMQCVEDQACRRASMCWSLQPEACAECFASRRLVLQQVGQRCVCSCDCQ